MTQIEQAYLSKGDSPKVAGALKAERVKTHRRMAELRTECRLLKAEIRRIEKRIREVKRRIRFTLTVIMPDNPLYIAGVMSDMAEGLQTLGLLLRAVTNDYHAQDSTLYRLSQDLGR